MNDPIESKQQKLAQLENDTGDKVRELINLTNKVNQARTKAQESLKTIQLAIDEAQKVYIDYINEMEIINIDIEKLRNN